MSMRIASPTESISSQGIPPSSALFLLLLLLLLLSSHCDSAASFISTLYSLVSSTVSPTHTHTHHPCRRPHVRHDMSADDEFLFFNKMPLEKKKRNNVILCKFSERFETVRDAPPNYKRSTRAPFTEGKLAGVGSICGTDHFNYATPFSLLT